MDPSKPDLRKLLKTTRDNISDRESRSKIIQESLCSFINSYSKEKGLKLSILAYANFGSEVATDLFIENCIIKKFNLFLPYCKNETLIPIKVIDPIQELSEGQFGVREPIPELINDQERNIDPNYLDIIIVPGIGFDCSGNRLGYGKGFYDRFLPRCPKGLKIALAFDCQIIERIPTDRFDHKVDFIISENTTIQIQSSNKKLIF